MLYNSFLSYLSWLNPESNSLEAPLNHEGLVGVDNLDLVEGGLTWKNVDKSGGDKE